jgi:hypothetical protein
MPGDPFKEEKGFLRSTNAEFPLGNTSQPSRNDQTHGAAFGKDSAPV